MYGIFVIMRCRAVLLFLITMGLILPVPRTARAAECALVATGGFDAVTVMDLATGEVTARIPTRERTVAVAVGPDGRTAYAANSDDNSVSVIDLIEGVVTTTIPVGTFPTDLVAHPDGRRVHVADRNSGHVSVIDLDVGAVVRTIPTGGGPSGLVITRDGRTGYTANFFPSTVTVLDLTSDRAVTNFGVGQQPFDLALSPDESRLYVTAVTSADVTVVDTATRTIVTTIPVGGFPNGVAVHPSGRFAYVSDAPDGGITVIDMVRNQVVTSFLLAEGSGTNAAAVAMTADGATAVVPDFVSGNLFLIDTARHSVSDFYPLGSSMAAPERLAIVTLPGGCPRPPIPRLTADVAAVDTEIHVDRIDAFPILGTLRIDDELLTYRSTFGGVVRDLTRGILGTVSAAHTAGTLVFIIRPGDANCDTRRGAADLVALVNDVVAGAQTGPCGNDVNGDRIVDPSDLAAAVSTTFGASRFGI